MGKDVVLLGGDGNYHEQGVDMKTNNIKTLFERLYRSPAWRKWNGMTRAGKRNAVEYAYFWHYGEIHTNSYFSGILKAAKPTI